MTFFVIATTSLPAYGQRGQITTQGKEFWLTFMHNPQSGIATDTLDLSIMISAKRYSRVTVENPNTGWRSVNYVSANTLTHISIPSSEAYLTTPTENTVNKGIRVSSTDTISLFSANFRSASYDAANIFPMSVLGSEYILQTYPPTVYYWSYDDYYSTFAIIATENGTLVDITPSVDIFTDTLRPAGTTFSVNLNRGQVVYMRSDDVYSYGDISGTRIKTRDCKKIAVFAGVENTLVPDYDTLAGDHIYEQIFPTDAFGTQFIVTNTLYDSVNSRVYDVLRITTTEDTTVVKKNGNIIDTILQAGQTHEYRLFGTEHSAFFETSSPSEVFLYMVSNEIHGNGIGDPSMVWIAPVEQFVDKINFSTFSPPYVIAGSPRVHFVNIVAKTSECANIMLDNTYIGGWQPVAGNPAYSFVRKQISHATHTISGADFSGYVYGLGTAVSYAYSVGTAVNRYYNMHIDGISIKDTNAPDTLFAGCNIQFAREVLFNYDTIIWDFGDSTPRKGGDTVYHRYSHAGSFNVRMFVYSSTLCNRDSDTLEYRFVIDTLRDTLYPVICAGTSFDTVGRSYTTRGTYIQHNRDLDSCLHNLVIYLTVKDTFRTFRYDTICAGQTFTYEGSPHTTTQTFVHTHTATTTECDSNVVVNLFVKDTFRTFRYDTICAGQVFTYEGTRYTTPTTFTFRHRTVGGCDSNVVVNLFVKDTFRTFRYDTICAGQTFIYGNKRYRTTGRYLNTHIARNGCDSNVVVNLFVRDTFRTVRYDTICAGQTFNYEGMPHTTTQRFVHTHTAHTTGCDSNVVVNLFVKDTFRTFRYDTICAGQTFNYEGIPHTTSKTFIYRHLSRGGCDSNVVVHLFVNDTFRTFRRDTICAGQIFTYEGIPHTISETFVFRHRTVRGCDSNVVVRLFVKDTFHTERHDTICAGQTFTYANNSYTTTGRYLYTHLARNGCDSNVVLNLFVRDTFRTLRYDTICTGQTFNYEGIPHTSSEIFIFRHTTTGGCDSNIVVNLFVKDTFRTFRYDTICAGQIFSYEGIQHTTSETFVFRHLTSGNCDSNVVVSLFVKDTFHTERHDTICAGQTFSYGNNGYTTTGRYLYTHVARNGCDSNVIINLFVKDTFRSFRHDTICAGQTFTYEGNPYTTSQTFVHTHTSVTTGCDSNVVVSLFVKDTFRTFRHDTICAGQTFTYGNNSYTTTGRYLNTHLARNGCDSNVVLNLFVKDTFRTERYDTICTGRTFTYEGVPHTITQTFEYTHTATTTGCDSNVVVHLFVNDTLRDTVMKTICMGESFDTNNSSSYTLPGEYLHTYREADSCWKNLTINLRVLDTTHIHIDSTICAGSVFIYNDSSYYLQNTYHQIVRHQNSCDIVTINLVVLDTLRDTIHRIVCAGASFDTNGQQYYYQGFHTQHLQDSLSRCFHNLVIDLTVNDTLRDTIYRTIGAGMSFDTNSYQYYLQGVFTQHLQDSTSRCYHNLVIDLIVNDTLRDTVHRTICAGASFDTNGQSYYHQGVYTQHLRDSITHLFHNLVIYLNVNDTLRDTVYRTVCAGAAFDTNGVKYYHRGVYTQHLRDSLTRCFHNLVIDLSVNDTLRDTVYRTICAGASFDTNGTRYYYQGIHTQHLRDSTSQCFHNLVIDLTVNDTLRDTVYRTICAGTTFDTNDASYYHTGIYTQHLRDSLTGCYHNLVIKLTVNDTSRDTLYPVICQGTTYYNGSNQYTRTGVYTATYSTAQGCDSIIVINLTVLDTVRDSVKRTICAGSSFDTLNTSYYLGGVYTRVVPDSTPCGMHYLTISINVVDTLRDTVYRTVCAGASFDTNGVRYHYQGIYTQHLRDSISHCFHNLVIDLTVNDTLRDTVHRTICAGASFDTNGVKYYYQGVYTQHLRQPDSCFNNLVIFLSVNDTLRDTIYRTVCAGASFDTNGVKYYYQGVYTQYLRQPDSCFNNLVIFLSVNDTLRDTIYRTVCAGTSFDTNGVKYYYQGVYTQHLRQPDSCYNNIVIFLSVNDTLRDTIYRTVCAGASFDTNGVKYYNQGVYTQQLRQPDSCFHNLVIFLSVNDTLRDTIYRTVCAGASFDTNGVKYYYQGVYTQHLRQPDSCFNNLVIFLTVNDTLRDTIYRTVCAGASFDTNGVKYYYQGVYTQHLRQPDSCFNNLVIFLSVNDTLRDTIYRTLCAGASFDTNGRQYYFQGVYTQHLRDNITRCYHNLVIDLKINDTLRDTVHRIICAGETFDTNGRSYAQAGVHRQYLRDPATRCYNNLVIHLTVNDTFRDHVYDTVCAGASFTYNDISYTLPGTHLQRYQTVLGCDSIVAIHLTVRDTLRDTVHPIVCAGATFDTNGISYYLQGFHTQHLRDTANDCFHNLVIDLTVTDTIRAHVYDTICEGETYRFNSVYYTTTGVYRHLMRNREGCDSITYLHLQVNNIARVRLYDTTYTGSYTYQDTVYTQTGIYYHLFNRVGTGCDSIVILHLYFCDSIVTKLYDTICNDSTYRFGNRILTQTGIYYWRGHSYKGCDSIVKLYLKVVDYPKLSIVDSGSYCFDGVATLKLITDGNHITWSSHPPDSSLVGQEHNPTIYVTPKRMTEYRVVVDSVPRVRTCTSTASKVLHKASMVKAQMTRTPYETDMNNLQTKFTDISIGNVVYREWLFHETSPMSLDRIEYDSVVWFTPFAESDNFRVRLAVRDDVGCTDTVVNIYPLLKGDLWVPNAFTPDEISNTLFKVGAYDIEEYEIFIYNRAGLMVFHSTNPDDSWDGTHDGKPCQPASYVYIIYYRTKADTKQRLKKVGSVLLIR